jgi:AraC-like DNA-binding protein
MDSNTLFLRMASHGHARRDPLPGGCVILSKLGAGSSLIEARAPSLKYVLAGEEVYEIGGRRRVLRPGNFMLVEAGQEVAVRTGGSENAVGLCVYFGCEGSAQPVGDLVSEAVVFGAASDELGMTLARYARRIAEVPERGEALAAPLMSEIACGLDVFMCDMDSKAERLSSLKRSTRVETLRRLERARSFIHEKADTQLALEEIARNAALSRFHLTRTFCELYGLPPLAYHRRVRLADAAGKLREGTHSAAELSEELGYASPSAFTRAFRQHFGVPPSRLAELT